MTGLDEKFSSMIDEQYDIRVKLKPVERRLKTLTEHIKQCDIYLKYKGNNVRNESTEILFTAAKNYLKGVMNGNTACH